jgi:hypothetical protein
MDKTAKRLGTKEKTLNSFYLFLATISKPDKIQQHLKLKLV